MNIFEKSYLNWFLSYKSYVLETFWNSEYFRRKWYAYQNLSFKDLHYIDFLSKGNKYFSGGRVYEKKRFRQKLFDGNINILTGIKIIVIIVSNQLNRKSSRVFTKRRSTSKIMKHYIYLFSNLIRNALTFLHSLQLL